MASIKYISARNRWRVRWHITCYDGSIDKGSQVFRFKSDALEFKKIVESKEHRLKSGLAKPTESIKHAADKWQSYNKQHTARTQQHYSMVIKKFTDSLPSQVTDIRQITTGHVQDYITAKIEGLGESRNPNRTANAHLTAIKSFCRWINSTYSVPNVSGAVKMLKENEPEARFLTPTEYEKVLRAVDGLDRDIILFAANTGLRATEFCELTTSDISHGHKSISLVGKGRKRRTIPLNATCVEILKRLKPKPNTTIFFSKSKTKRPRHLIYQVCVSAAKAAEVPVFGPHSLRHHFATELLLRGVPIAKVSKLLGHASIRTTEKIYIHILDKDLDGLTECLVSP